jgi:hypothetical protein
MKFLNEMLECLRTEDKKELKLPAHTAISIPEGVENKNCRHCERSEANQVLASKRIEIASWPKTVLAMTKTVVFQQPARNVI